jgi:fumarylacetoacetase
MRPILDETHDPRARSRVESANSGHTDFPIQNLPFGVFRRSGDHARRIGVAIGDSILDLRACCETGSLKNLDAGTGAACRSVVLNELMKLSSEQRRCLRREIFRLLNREVEPAGQIPNELLFDAADAEMHLPVEVGDYTDFYASVFHATNVGSMFRPNNPLLPNYKWVPIGYHGRASSLVVSGTGIRRPWGQTMPAGANAPLYRPSSRLDYELEVGVYIAVGNQLGEPIPIDQAEERMFGLSLVNDWSARDIQSWEYQPLGPFLGKSFATTVSPWVVTREALAPYRTAPSLRPDNHPLPLPYLQAQDDQHDGFDILLDVELSSAKMRAKGIAPQRLSAASFRDVYWTMTQLMTHHASNGCNLRPGDLLASGTVSGASPESRGCLLELTWNGTQSIELAGGEKRTFLEDGDEIIFRGRCQAPGKAQIGFGECRGKIVGAHA